ncbi:MAG: LacI family DNA-binding transcriptional regulator [Phycisphaeraceae bacterium]
MPQRSSKKPPARLVDIAKAAGVSRVTVGQVLNRSGGASVRVGESTRQRVLEIARTMNYRPNRVAQQLRGVRSHMLGVILDTINIPVMYARLAHLEREATLRGYRLTIGQVHHDPAGIADYLDDFEGRGIEGVMFLFDLMKGYTEELKPVFEGRHNILFHSRPVDEESSCVRVDTSDAIRQCVGHLVDTGRKRIGVALWNLADQLMLRRREGYEAELNDRGMPVDPNLIWSAESPSEAPSEESINAAIDALVVDQQADAIIASNDYWAVRLIQQLKRRGLRVPEDVAVIGYDNLDIATVIEPSLTTVDQQHEAYAKAAVNLLIRLIERDDTLPTNERNVVIKPKLIVRESTATPAQGE